MTFWFTLLISAATSNMCALYYKDYWKTKGEKCEFHKYTFALLGYNIDTMGVSMDQKAPPQSIKDLKDSWVLLTFTDMSYETIAPLLLHWHRLQKGKEEIILKSRSRECICQIKGGIYHSAHSKNPEPGGSVYCQSGCFQHWCGHYNIQGKNRSCTQSGYMT